MDDDAMSCSFAISNHVWASGLCLIKMWQQLKQSYTDKPNIYIQDCGGSAERLLSNFKFQNWVSSNCHCNSFQGSTESKMKNESYLVTEQQLLGGKNVNKISSI